MKHHGCKHMMLQLPSGEGVGIRFDVLDVVKPILSAGALCSRGWSVMLDKEPRFEKAGCAIVPFKRSGSMLLLDARVVAGARMDAQVYPAMEAKCLVAPVVEEAAKLQGGGAADMEEMCVQTVKGPSMPYTP